MAQDVTAAAGERQVPDRGRRRSRRRQPRGLHSREPRAAGLRLRRDLRHQPVRPGHSGDHLRAQGSGLLRAACPRGQPRFALRYLRRCRRQPGQRRWRRSWRASRVKTARSRFPASTIRWSPLADWERVEFAKLPFSEADFQADLGVPSLEGEAGYTTLERKWARPTCDVNGLFGGYAGPGPKTVLPARPAPSSASGWSPTRTPKPSTASFATTLPGCARRG